MESFCEDLRRERERRRVSVESICAATKIPVRHVEALETGRLGELPGGVFRRNILRSYLKAAGLEEANWAERFERALAERGVGRVAADDWMAFAENVKSSRVETGRARGRRWMGLTGMILLLALLGVAMWVYVAKPRLAAGRGSAELRQSAEAGRLRTGN